MRATIFTLLSPPCRHRWVKHLNLYHIKTTKTDSKWIKDLNIRPETINYIKENISTKLMNLDLREDFYEFGSKGKESKGKLNEWDYTKLKSCCTAKQNKIK